jgi:hypothetical protein
VTALVECSEAEIMLIASVLRSRRSEICELSRCTQLAREVADKASGHGVTAHLAEQATALRDRFVSRLGDGESERGAIDALLAKLEKQR